MPKTTRINARCPYCRAVNDRATSPEDDAPSAGDLSICAHCGALALFTARLGLRLPTGKEAKAILANQETMASLHKARADMVRLVRLSRQEDAERN